MTTIPAYAYNSAKGLAKEVYDDINRTYGISEPHGIYQLMGYTPEFLDASWRRSRYLYGTKTRFSIRDKHVFTLAISAINNCEYCVRIHTERLRGLGMTLDELLEAMVVVDVAIGASKFAEGTRAGDREVIPPVDDDVDASTEEAFNKLKQAIGASDPNILYSILARRSEFLAATWERRRLCFGEDGLLGKKMKHLIAYCVSATSGNDYLTTFHASRAMEFGVTEDCLTEVLLIVDLVCGYNRYVQGLQVEEEKKPFGPGGEMEKAVSK